MRTIVVIRRGHSTANDPNAGATMTTEGLAFANRTVENVWVTHGLVIAGICELLGDAERYERRVPRQYEVRLLTF